MAAVVLVALALSALQVSGYIPAIPTNDTAAAQGIPINLTDSSTLTLTWNPMGSYTETVSYQVAGTNTTGLSQGALVHFSEQNLSNDTTLTPWIAFVACDANATDASQLYDIFTLAQDRGAVSALLYSQWSDSCVINPEYADPAEFNQIFDIFSTKRLTDAKLIENQFANVNATYANYNSSLLNSSFTDVEDAINGNTTGPPGYLVATLKAANATAFPTSSSFGGPDQSASPSPAKKGPPNTSLAMIILYAITGCVSALFCVVIITGAVRAIRNPERYGPRGPDPTMGMGQSRTQGLGRAIVDTFPIIKFGRDNTPLPTTANKDAAANYANNQHVEMTDIRSPQSPRHQTEKDHYDAETSQGDVTSVGQSSTHDQDQSTPAAVDPLNPAAIGHETCPICIVDFEEGDDLRVLPCEGKHRFHQACVDPWLLELSSSCPLCREDFQTLESMVQGDYPDPNAGPSDRPSLTATQADSAPHGRNTRLSKYLRFAQRRRNHGSHRHESSSTLDETHGWS
ncbi:hypothetical protein SISSUDRAFT_980047 [Sistotremastrum suecicum HHB10207 ss-3]|uniref:RING-type domain-containing protein n=1 Tax=Sistotremastrum suecicum HHB10207 ss-3 TaxID=1314776 RepID=A0A166H9B3_9AGAM|nr:hypothetical protein SISSUDRAFT_980047 [Sistotremastrum suecicum HHB10207 ss-3]